MIIGMAGPQRSGKTTVCQILMERHGVKFMSIGAEIKAHTHALIGSVFDEKYKDVPQASMGMKTPRDLYIHVGQIDEFVPTLWVNKMLRNQYYGPDEFHVVESVGKQVQWRTIKEFSYRQRAACIVFNVSRDGAEYKDNRSHLTDPLRTVEIVNNGSLEELSAQVDEKFSEFKQKISQYYINDLKELL